MITRRAFLRALAGLGLAGVATGAYATVVSPGLRLRVQRWTVRPAGFPEGPPLRIAVLADVHAGPPWMSVERIEGIVEATNALAPDLVALLGDYVADHPFRTRAVAPAEIVRACTVLEAPMGVFAVMGNHDWSLDPEAQRQGHGPTATHRAFVAHGIPLLSNQAMALDRPGGGRGDGRVWIAGLDSQMALTPMAGWRGDWVGLDDLDATMAQIDDDGAPVVLMAHEPDIFPRVPSRVSVTLSGHTHGGQVRLFGYAPVVPSHYGNRYAYGHVEEGGRDLVVSGGLGCSIAPVRLGVPPEITLVELRAPA